MIEPHAAEAKQTKTILIVEDDIEIGYFLAQALKEEPYYQVIFATDGFQALKMVQTLVPNLVLLDYLLPRVNGLEVAQQLRASEDDGLRHVPIILMSANLPKHIPSYEDILVLHKPFDLDALLKRIKQILSR
jgi:DNA-binding response OmpR family regulator